MKNFKSTVLAIFAFVILPGAAICQLQTFQSENIKFNIEKHEDYSTSTINFESPQSNVMFSLPAVSGMNSMINRNRIKFQLYGISNSGHKVAPIVSHLDKSENHIHIADVSFSINPGIISDINLYFPEPIISLNILADFNINPSYLESIKREAIYINNEKNFVKNPSAPNCIEHLAIVVDQSYSMKDQELDAIRSAIQNWIYLGREEKSDIQLSIVSFDETSTITINQEDINHPKSKSKIINALSNKKLSSNNTDWASGLEATYPLDADLILFITDSPPNTIEGNKVNRTQALSEAMAIADQIKLSGTRIIPVGADMLIENNAIQWFNFITSDKSSLGLIHPNSWNSNNIALMDYVILNDYLDLDHVLNNIENQCIKEYIDEPIKQNLEFSTFPNPTYNNIALKLSKFDITQGYSFNIISADGKILKSGKINNSTSVIDIRSLAASNYYIQVIDKENSIVYSDQFSKLR